MNVFDFKVFTYVARLNSISLAADTASNNPYY